MIVASPTIEVGSTIELGSPVPITFGRADDNRAVLRSDDSSPATTPASSPHATASGSSISTPRTARG